MTTTIVPALGNAPLMTQAGVGTSPGYQAVDVRRMVNDFEVGESIITYGSFLVQQRGAGANMSVDISMDDLAYIRGDAVTLQGLYPVPPHSATINEVIGTSDPTNPRVDRAILEVLDTTHDASGSNLVRTRIVAGTPSAGATLDNLTGAAAVPGSALLLADVLVPAAAASITNAQIRDRRSFQTGCVPPLLTDIDMVAPIPVPGLSVAALTSITPADLNQSAVLVWIPRRIASATRIRWRYTQGGTTAVTGNYVFALYDASGRKIIDTGSVAFTGAINSEQVRSETITATTFEPGAYYLFWGVDTTNAGTVSFAGVTVPTNAVLPNQFLYSLTGGVTVPNTILGFTDKSGTGTGNNGQAPPMIGISVG